MNCMVRLFFLTWRELKNIVFAILFCTSPTLALTDDPLEYFNPQWKACELLTDCVLVREGVSCSWTAVNKLHLEAFRVWDGYINRKMGASLSCRVSHQLNETDMTMACENKNCVSQIKKSLHPKSAESQAKCYRTVSIGSSGAMERKTQIYQNNVSAAKVRFCKNIKVRGDIIFADCPQACSAE